MYVKYLEIAHLGPIAQVDWSVQGEQMAGWHVILGENGSGKSSMLRAFMLALAGSGPIVRWAPSVRSWIRSQHEKASVVAGFKVTHPEALSMLPSMCDAPWKTAQSFHGREALRAYAINMNGVAISESTTSYMRGRGDRFASLALGTSRRWSNRVDQNDNVHINDPVAARFITLLASESSLNSGIDWIRSLRFESLIAAQKGETSSRAATLLDAARAVCRAPRVRVRAKRGNIARSLA